MKLTKSMLENLKKAEIIELYLELQNSNNNVVALDNISCVVVTKAYNNSNSGSKSDGGELYNRCRNTFKITNGNMLKYNSTFYVPSGYGDGSTDDISGDLILNDLQIIEIKKIGFTKWCTQYFKIKKILDNKYDSPLVLR